MTDYLSDNFTIYCGDVIEKIKEIEDNSVYTCVTSPPYYGLRDYGTGTWVGGDPNCPHYRTTKIGESTTTGHKSMSEQGESAGDAIYKTVCPLCGAVRVDNQIGLEETPEEFIDKLVKVFHEVKRVLKDDGTLWVNIGDSYCGSADNIGVYKNKDLIGIPWMLAFALREDDWYLRQDIIWHKPNPMPESVKDRCTKSHEYIFLLSKQPKYYFDNKSIQESCVSNTNNPNIKFGGYKYGDNEDEKFATYSGNTWMPTEKRNKRDVWSVPTKPFKGAHFATFPEDLITPCVLAGCPEGETVIDPFSGSGTTGVVANKHKRKYIGIELNPEYANMSIDRLKNVNIKKVLW